MKLKILAVALLATLQIPLGCSRFSQPKTISGTYTECVEKLGEMLQITQTSTGQITGVLSRVMVDEKYKVSNTRSPITAGQIDKDQLTLVVGDTYIGGTVDGDTITFQTVAPNGFSKNTFKKSTGEEFLKCSIRLHNSALLAP